MSEPSNIFNRCAQVLADAKQCPDVKAFDQAAADRCKRGHPSSALKSKSARWEKSHDWLKGGGT
jgi:hypothetical protein